MELSSGGQASYSTSFPCQVRVLGAHLYQCTSWYCCERLCLASVNFFGRLLHHICPFHDDDLPVHLPALCRAFSSFGQKQHDPHVPPFPKRLFVCAFLQMIKVLKGKHFTDLEEVKKKAETLKSIKINKFKNCFEQWRKCLSRCFASNGEYFEGD